MILHRVCGSERCSYVFLNSRVTILVSFSVYVKVAHFCLYLVVCSVLCDLVCVLFAVYT